VITSITLQKKQQKKFGAEYKIINVRFMFSNTVFLFFRWKNLQGDLGEYRVRLGVALEIHALVRDIR
jgi:hypothetical protein